MRYDTRPAGERHVRRKRIALSLAIGMTAAAGILAATALPAFANGSNGNHGKSASAPGHTKTSGSASPSRGKSASAPGHTKTSGGASPSRGNSANAHERVTICHATPPDTAADGYTRITLSGAGAFNGHYREHAADIIPPFLYSGVTYSLNWDATGQAIWNNGCVVPASTTSTSTPTSSSGVAGASHVAAGTHASATGGVKGAHKTLGRVAGRARAPRAVKGTASFTG